MKIKYIFPTIFSYLRADKYLKHFAIIFLLIIMISFLFPRGKVLKYSYQVNDIASDEIIAPFTFPILKSDERLQLDLNDRKKSIPYIFNRDDQIVSQSISALREFFNLVKDLRNAHWRLDQSKKLVYEMRYNKQYEKARSEYISDSTNNFSVALFIFLIVFELFSRILFGVNLIHTLG